MYRLLSLQSLLLILFPYSLKSQIIPQEGSVLNYRLIGFSVPLKPGVADYMLQIAAGNYDSEDSFTKNIILTQHTNANKIIAEVPRFGSQNTWRLVPVSDQSAKTKSELHHFVTGAIPEVDTNNIRLRITQAALKFKDAYVFLEGNKVLYDMKGNPVWYLPPIEGVSVCPIDLKLSPNGSITFLANNNAYEIDYNGNILWRTPGNRVNGPLSCHHEFSRLNNGHYMVLGTEVVRLKRSFSSTKDSKFPVALDDKDNTGKNDTSFMEVPFGNIKEYDEKGNIAWTWQSFKYFKGSDLINYTPMNRHPFIDMHENSFYFDEKDKIIYLSCKGISRIIKIKYPEGTVINSYGETYAQGVPENDNSLFCGQHSVKQAKDGCVFLFNNNSCNPGAPPKIKKIHQPISEHDSLKIIWKYDCFAEDSIPRMCPTGGNVMELSDESIFASIGGSYGKIFIVNPTKEILWSAQSESWNETEKKWYSIGQYRASIIEDKKEMEHLIWNTEINDIAEIKHNEIKNKRIAGALP